SPFRAGRAQRFRERTELRPGAAAHLLERLIPDHLACAHRGGQEWLALEPLVGRADLVADHGPVRMATEDLLGSGDRGLVRGAFPHAVPLLAATASHELVDAVHDR